MGQSVIVFFSRAMYCRQHEMCICGLGMCRESYLGLCQCVVVAMKSSEDDSQHGRGGRVRGNERQRAPDRRFGQIILLIAQE